MNDVECLNCLLEVEEKHHLLNENIDGFYFWVFYRQELMWDLLLRKNNYGEAHQANKMSVKEKWKLRLNMIKNAVKYNKVSMKNVDMLVFNHERRVWNGETYDCIYTDEIARKFNSSVVVERPYQQNHFRPVSTRNLIYTDWIETVATVYMYLHKYILKKQYQQIQNEIRVKIESACHELMQLLEVEYSLEKIISVMTDGYFLYQKKRKLFMGLLQKYNPRVILEVVSYNMDCMIVNELAFEKNIPTIELQHGTTGKEHLAYNYPSGMAIKQFPQYYFAFSTFWCKEARYPIPAGRCKAVGFPYLEQNVKKFCAVEKEEKKVILFISQGPIGKELSRIAMELNNKIDKDKYRIIYKLHPGEYAEWQQRYPELAQSGIEVIDNNKIELYYLFSISSYQVGGYGSTATFEGLYFGLQTFVYEKEAVSYLQSLWEQGIAQKFNDSDELYLLLQNSSENVDKANTFWMSNALENMQQEILKIMNNTGQKN